MNVPPEPLSRLLGRPLPPFSLPCQSGYLKEVLRGQLWCPVAGCSLFTALVSLSWPVIGGMVFWGLGLALSLWTLAGIVLKYTEKIEITTEGCVCSNAIGSRQIQWRDLKRFKLHAYPKSGATIGFFGAQQRASRSMLLALSFQDGAHKITIQSNLTHFPALLHMAFTAAVDAQLPLSEVTVSNLKAAGFSPPSIQPADETEQEREGI